MNSLIACVEQDLNSTSWRSALYGPFAGRACCLRVFASGSVSISTNLRPLSPLSTTACQALDSNNGCRVISVCTGNSFILKSAIKLVVETAIIVCSRAGTHPWVFSNDTPFTFFAQITEVLSPVVRCLQRGYHTSYSSVTFQSFTLCKVLLLANICLTYSYLWLRDKGCSFLASFTMIHIDTFRLQCRHFPAYFFSPDSLAFGLEWLRVRVFFGWSSALLPLG